MGASFIVLGLCEASLLIDVLADFLFLDIPSLLIDHSQIELVTVIALGLALLVIGKNFLDLWRENRMNRETLQMASGRFFSIMNGKFDDWGLSASEREIALFLIKGLSTQEIAGLRQTRPGTIKSQCNAVYRKADIRGRNELVAYFVEDLLAGEELVENTEKS